MVTSSQLDMEQAIPPPVTEMPPHPPAPDPAYRAPSSVRFSLSSFLGRSSIYSNSPGLVGSQPLKKQSARDAVDHCSPCRTMRSRTSTRSLIDPGTTAETALRPLDPTPHESWYRPLHSTTPSAYPPQQIFAHASSTTMVRGTLSPGEARVQRKPRGHHRRRRYGKMTREAFKDPKVRTKASLTLAFGITLFATLAVCKLLFLHREFKLHSERSLPPKKSKSKTSY